jgi:Nickel responsive protein SCO4226-like
MPLFLVERNFAEDLDVTADSVSGIQAINDDVGVQWIYSFLSSDRRKTYCLYEAETEEMIREAAQRANLPADVIVPLEGKIDPNEYVGSSAQ